MFIPTGCIPLSDVIEQVASDIDPAAMRSPKPEAVQRAERANALQADFDPSYKPPPSSSPEGIEIAKWKVIEARQLKAKDIARQQLRQPLGNGILSARALLPDGSIVRTSAKPWRTSEGSKALKIAHVMTGGVFVAGQTFDHPQPCPLFVPERTSASGAKCRGIL
jgi:hypothetical protein